MLRNKLFRKSLGVLMVTGICVLAIAGNVRGDTQSDTTLKVQWLVKASSLAYDTSSECTESYHQYYIQNNSDLNLKFKFEFSHKVYLIITDPITKKKTESFFDSDVVDQLAPPGAATLNNGESDINWRWNMVDIGGRSGDYKIKAYTQLRVKKRRHGHDTPLFDTRQAREVYEFSI